ncbi:MAG: hypothetical protein R3Y64_10725 [Peptostreptococcaceae bacterium]
MFSKVSNKVRKIAKVVVSNEINNFLGTSVSVEHKDMFKMRDIEVGDLMVNLANHNSQMQIGQMLLATGRVIKTATIVNDKDFRNIGATYELNEELLREFAHFRNIGRLGHLKKSEYKLPKIKKPASLGLSKKVEKIVFKKPALNKPVLKNTAINKSNKKYVGSLSN